MLIFPLPQVSIESCLKTGIKGALFALSLLLIYAFKLLLFPSSSLHEVEANSPSSTKTLTPRYAYEAIGTGALSLHPSHAFGWVSRIADELSLIAFNSRPDVTPNEAALLLYLKSNRKEVRVLNGSTLFLKEMKEGRGLEISEQPSLFWIKPILLDKGTVLVETGRKLVVAGGEEKEEKGQFLLALTQGTPFVNSSLESDYLKTLKTARFFPRDMLIQKYCGSEYANMQQKATLQFWVYKDAEPVASYARFIVVGEELVYENGKWNIQSTDRNCCGLPIAKITQLSQGLIELQVWDETGFHQMQVELKADLGKPLSLQKEAMPMKIRLRSSSQISCVLGKRRVILRQGDWVLKTASSWKTLRRKEEIEGCLLHEMKGELLVFDSIEKEGGKWVMKAHLFDETRLHCQPLSLPIEVGGMQTRPSRKKPLPAHLRA